MEFAIAFAAGEGTVGDRELGEVIHGPLVHSGGKEAVEARGGQVEEALPVAAAEAEGAGGGEEALPLFPRVAI